ncbi:MAG: hypothetical protein ACPHO8_12660, partial [Mariniblastus sp.]
NQMDQLIRFGVADSMADAVAALVPDCEAKLIAHLKQLEGKTNPRNVIRPVSVLGSDAETDTK